MPNITFHALIVNFKYEKQRKNYLPLFLCDLYEFYRACLVNF